MEKERIKLPFKLGLLISKILKEQHNIHIQPRTDNRGISEFYFTMEELDLITSLKFKNPVSGNLDGIHLLPNIQTLEVETLAITEHLQDKNIPSLSDKDVASISKCISLKKLSVVNQAKISYLDVSKLENLQKLTITHNQHLEEIDGIDKLQQLWGLDCYGNNRLFNVGGLDKIIINNSELAEVNLDVLLFPEAIGYNLINGEYNKQAVRTLKELSDMGQVSWCEGLSANTAIKINNNQMIQMHNKACKILEENVSTTADTKDTVVAIEKYLSENVKYDYDGMKNEHTNATTVDIGGKQVRMQNGPKVGTNGAYNALIFNTCVCEGYTRGMQYLLKLRGINSHNVDCYGEKDSTHMADGLNETIYTKYKMPDLSEYHSIICIDDYYNLYDDPCWNACRYQAGDKSMPWILKTKEEISKDHTLSFGERNVSNNHCSQPSEIIQDSIRKNSLFIQQRTSFSSTMKTKNEIKNHIKGQIIEKEDMNYEH